MNLFFGKPSFSALLIRGLIIIAIGIYGVIYPALFTQVLLGVIGLLLLIFGVSSFFQLRKKDQTKFQRDFIYGKAGVNIAIGLVLILFPNLFTSFILFIVGFITLLAGIMQLSMFLSNRNSFGLGNAGVFVPLLITIVGFVIIFRPNESSLSLTRLLAGIACVYGAWEVVLALKLKKNTTVEYAKFEEIKD